MNKKYFLILLALTATAISRISGCSNKTKAREPIFITGYASIEEMSLDNLISEADLIVIGEVKSTDPSHWNTEDGLLPSDITAKNINSKFAIYTDQLFLPNFIIKGETQPSIRIRYFGGQVNQDIMTVSGEVPLETQKGYLLFLVEDVLGTTANINKGHYIVLGSNQGVYEVNNNKAISFRDEWDLDELITYIQISISSKETSPESLPSEKLTPTP